MKRIFNTQQNETPVVYYDDPLLDEFSGVGERAKVRVDASFPYIRSSPLWRLARFFVYRVIMRPVAYLYCKGKLHLRIEGKEKLLPYCKQGYFLYGNHTQIPGDGYMPNVLAFPKDVYMIVNPDNIAFPGTKNLMMMLGTLPIPTEISGFSAFDAALRTRLFEGGCIMVYPEAHIWPYCTFIRPFSAVSFRYPVKYNVPAFSFTVTYRRTKGGRPAVVAYVDGPFWGTGDCPKAKQQDLHRQVYSAMCARADTPENVAFVNYQLKAQNPAETLSPIKEES